MRRGWSKGRFGILLGVLLLGGMAYWAFWPHQTRYAGRPLGYWLDQINSSDTNLQRAARRAFQCAGLDAVPFLLRRAGAESSLWKRAYQEAWLKLPDPIRGRFPEPKSEDDVVNQVARALHLLGPQAGPVLLEALKDQNSSVRCAAAWSFPYREDRPAHVLWLARLLETPDYDSKQGAAGMLGTLGTNAWPAIPSLVRVLQTDQIGYVRETAARSLACVAGPGTECAASGLKSALNDPLNSVRAWSAVALWRINRDTNVIALLIKELDGVSAEDGSCHTVIEVLGEAGALAKPAVPAIRAKMLAYSLERALPEGAGSLIQTAREALLRIDPRAVPEFDVPVP